MNKNINSISKVAAIVAASALVAMSFGAGAVAHAQTTTTTTTLTSSQVAALESQIASLQAQLSAATGGSTSASVTFSRDLTVGSTGSDVTALQSWLIAKGYSIPAGATGYFGGETKAALAAYQAANGISPAVGYFGPITRAKVNAAGGSTTTTTTTTTTGGTTSLSGGEGSVNNFQSVGSSSITMGTGASAQVNGFQFSAGGSDLEVSRLYYDFYNTNASSPAGTTRPWNLFGTATLMNGSGQTVATLDASNQNNWSEAGTAADSNQIYRLDFENVNNVVKEGTTQQYFLMLTTQGAFASGNAPATFSVGLEAQGLRATDAMGLQEYSPSSTNNSTVTVNTNTSGSVTLSTGSDNPQTTTLMANQNTSTQGVVLNTFTLQNTGSASVELYTLPVTLTTSTATSSYLVQDLKLYNGSTLLDTESPTSTGLSPVTLSFKNINLSVPAGTTDHFSIQADIQPVGGSNPASSGSSATVTVNGSASGLDLETSSGATITPSGTSTGYPISFAINGLSVASSPTSATGVATLSSGGNGTQQTGTFTFTFNVTAFGQTIYVGSTSAAYALSILDQTAGTATSTTNITSALTSSATRSPLGNWQVNSGQTATFTVSATLKNGGASHYYYATLNNIVYGIIDANASTTSVTLPSTYTTNAVSVSS